MRWYHDATKDALRFALLDALRQVRGMVVLSGYPHPLYDAALISAVRGTGTRTECVWLNHACAQATRQTSLALEGGAA